jgi:hypothetical protein
LEEGRNSGKGRSTGRCVRGKKKRRMRGRKEWHWEREEKKRYGR